MRDSPGQAGPIRRRSFTSESGTCPTRGAVPHVVGAVWLRTRNRSGQVGESAQRGGVPANADSVAEFFGREVELFDGVDGARGWPCYQAVQLLELRWIVA